MEKLSWSVFHRITLIERPFPRYLLVLLNFKVGNVLLPRFFSLVSSRLILVSSVPSVG